MYPFLHLLPDGMLFFFVDRSSEIFDVATNTTVKTMPTMPGMHRTYPNTGGSVMLPLRRGDNYEPEIMICGGGEYQDISSPCDASCGRLKPFSRNPEWEMTAMPEPRGMVEGVLLLDGTVLWINGCQQGAQGFGDAKSPGLTAMIYDPNARTWSTHGTSTIARLYHSVAMLLLDGTVLIAGSNPSVMPLLPKNVNVHDRCKAFPTEYRVEIYTPPYLQGRKEFQRPTQITLSTHELRMGSSFSIAFRAPRNALAMVDIILSAGGFVTHSVHMGQVMVYLETNGWVASGRRRWKHVEARVPEGIKLAPGPYVVYVVVNGVPGVGQFVTLSA